MAKEVRKITVKLYPSITLADISLDAQATTGSQPQSLSVIVNCKRVGKGRFSYQVLTDARGTESPRCCVESFDGQWPERRTMLIK